MLIDERTGRLAAEKLGLTTIGLLGILDRADMVGLADFETIFGQIPKDFRIAPALVEEARKRARERRRKE